VVEVNLDLAGYIFDFNLKRTPTFPVLAWNENEPSSFDDGIFVQRFVIKQIR
jgi:hypothetical protein